MSRHRGGNPPSTTLYVRNISDRVRYDDLRRLFSKYGRIVDVVIPLDYYSGNPKGYCFVEYEDGRDAEEAQYRMDRQRLFGREIEVEFARGVRKSSSEMRTRDRGVYGSSRSMRDGSGYESRGSRDRERRRTRSRSSSPRPRSDRRGGGANERGRGERDGRPERPDDNRSRSRSYPSNRTPSPAHPRQARYPKSASKDRSRSPRDRSESPRHSPPPRRHNNPVDSRSPSPVMNKRDQRSSRNSRSPSPA